MRVDTEMSADPGSTQREARADEPPADREALLEKVRRFPASPGVYIMRDCRNRTLYVGKAVNLRSRVRSYFAKSSDTRIFYKFLVERIADVDCIVTASEAEALILENNLIKKRRPLFNIRLRDDKNYVCLKVTVTEEWPRVKVTRRYQNDGDVYFGPYGSAGSVREMLRVIKKVFPLRTCTNGFFATRKRPCIEYDIGRCTAPCVDLISREKYMEDVDEVILFLRGQNKKLLDLLDGKMRRASENRQFELAARYRDQIRAIERVFEVQKAQDVAFGEMDVFAHHRQGDAVAVHELVIRDGKIINSHTHSFRSNLESAEIIASFLTQYYLADRFVPPRILCDTDFPERDVLSQWLREKRGSAVEVRVPQRGDRKRLVEMASENARNHFEVARSRTERVHTTLEGLQKRLELSRYPRRIECFDISNFQGRLAVGSMVVFEDGLPERSQYRKFRIKTVSGADDFSMMREVLERRFRDWREAPHDLPDLVVIDGGKGQLGVAYAVFRKLDIDDVGLVSLAKKRRRRGTTERIFIPGRSDPLPMTQDSAESLLIQHIRDEAHRFAIRYHRELRKKAAVRTGLEGIPGVGRKRAEKLLRHFGSVKRLREADLDSIREVVGPKLAEAIHHRLHETDGAAESRTSRR